LQRLTIKTLMPSKLSEIPALRDHLTQLQALGYTTLDELANAANIVPGRLSTYLGTDAVALINSLQVPVEAPSPQEAAILAQATYSLGVALDRIPRSVEAWDSVYAATVGAAAAPTPAPPTSTNFVSDFLPIKDQGERGTCVSYASVAALEQYHFTKTNARVAYSEQFMYWDCKQHDGNPNSEGTWLGIAFPLLKNDGCCLATTWPYVKTKIPGNESQAPAPANAGTQASGYRIPGYNKLAPTSVTSIKTELLRRRAVSFSIPVYNSWYLNAAVQLSGNIIMPTPGEAATGGHAMCIAGYTESADDALVGGGRFIIRNSWNSQWGIRFKLPNGTPQPGYGTIPYAYISHYCSEAYSIA
jgi:C1A family cysteine protease